MITRIDKYEIEKELGHGGFGHVYLAFDPDVGQKVAIKLLRIELGADPDTLKRFQHEIRITASLRHKNIVTIHACGVMEGSPYLVMEFLEGKTLREVIQSKAPLSFLTTVDIMTQAAEGLAFAHARGIVHRDVKPENIMLLPDGVVKIMDFGIAVAPNRTRVVTQTGGLIGTLLYFAPEQLEGIKANEQTDLFSLGDIYYELLAGEHPFGRHKHDQDALWADILNCEPTPVNQVSPYCPESLAFVVHTMIAKERSIRYSSFKEFLLDNKAILVDLQREQSASLLREVGPLAMSGDLQAAMAKLDEVLELDPGNREARQFREQIQRRQAQARAADLLTEARAHLTFRRFNEAVGLLELAARLDGANVDILICLRDAKSQLESSVRASRLVSEARLKQQRGYFSEALDRLKAALTIDPENTEASALLPAVREVLQREEGEKLFQQALQKASGHLARREYTDALATLTAIEQEQPDRPEVAELRGRTEQGRIEYERQRGEKLELAITRTLEAIRSGQLERAQQMIEHLFFNFGSEPGVTAELESLQNQLSEQTRAAQITDRTRMVHDLLQSKSYREALEILNAAVLEFPNNPVLVQLKRSAGDLFQAQQRSHAVNAALEQAGMLRAARNQQAAVAALSAARQELGDEPALVELAQQLENEIERQRYVGGLEELLQTSRELLAHGHISDAIDKLDRAREYSGEAEVRALLERARISAAVEEKCKLVAEALATTDRLNSAGDLEGALNTIEEALAQYPEATELVHVAAHLRDQIKHERRHTAIENHRAAILQEIQSAAWENAEAGLQQAKAEFPSGNDFDALAEQLETARHNSRFNELVSKIQEKLAAGNFRGAAEELETTATIFSHDLRWDELVEEIGRREAYGKALIEATRLRDCGNLQQAEEVLAEVANQHAPDDRAAEILRIIQAERAELRRTEISKIVATVREAIRLGDLDRAADQLNIARSAYSNDAEWTPLAADLEDQERNRRQKDIDALSQNVRGCLSREDSCGATTHLALALAKYPAEGLWSTLQAEIEAQRAAVGRRHAIALMVEGIREGVRLNDLDSAVASLNAGRTSYPDETIWAALQTEIEALQIEKVAAEITSLVERIRLGIQDNDIKRATEALGRGRLQYPGVLIWEVVESEINAHQALLQHHAAISAVTNLIQAHLINNELTLAKSELLAARLRYPDEQQVWETLAGEIEFRHAQARLPADRASEGPRVTETEAPVSERISPAVPRPSTLLRERSESRRSLRLAIWAIAIVAIFAGPIGYRLYQSYLIPPLPSDALVHGVVPPAPIEGPKRPPDPIQTPKAGLAQAQSQRADPQPAVTRDGPKLKTPEAGAESGPGGAVLDPSRTTVHQDTSGGPIASAVPAITQRELRKSPDKKYLGPTIKPDLEWSGILPPQGELRIRYDDASEGHLRPKQVLPWAPGRVTAITPGVLCSEQPSRENGWTALFRNTSSAPITVIKFRWEQVD